MVQSFLIVLASFETIKFVMLPSSQRKFIRYPNQVSNKKNHMQDDCWTKVHFVGPLIVPILDFVWPSLCVFKPRVVLSPAHLLACLWWTFSTNRGVHCISMYTADSPSGHPSCKQWRAGNGGLLTWAAVRFNLRPHVWQANVLSTWPLYPLWGLITSNKKKHKSTMAWKPHGQSSIE